MVYDKWKIGRWSNPTTIKSHADENSPKEIHANSILQKEFGNWGGWYSKLGTHELQTWVRDHLLQLGESLEGPSFQKIRQKSLDKALWLENSQQ